MVFEIPLKDFDEEINKRITANMKWLEEEIMNTLEIVLEGLMVFHSHGLIHGDLNARHIVFCEDKNIKIAD